MCLLYTLQYSIRRWRLATHAICAWSLPWRCSRSLSTACTACCHQFCGAVLTATCMHITNNSRSNANIKGNSTQSGQLRPIAARTAYFALTAEQCIASVIPVPTAGKAAQHRGRRCNMLARRMRKHQLSAVDLQHTWEQYSYAPVASAYGTPCTERSAA